MNCFSILDCISLTLLLFAIFVFQNRQNEEIIKKNPLANRTELSCIEHHTIQRTIVDTNQTNPCSPDYKSDYDRTYLFIYSQGNKRPLKRYSSYRTARNRICSFWVYLMRCIMSTPVRRMRLPPTQCL